MNRKSSALFLGVACTLMLAAGLVPRTVSAQQKAASAKTLQIGYVLCANGWFRVMDAVEEKNLKIVEQMLNERGGITVQGQKYNIQLVGEDGNSTLDGVSAAATKLV
jgi:hypothetical protein